MKILDIKLHRQLYEQTVWPSAIAKEQFGAILQDERSEGYFALDGDLFLGCAVQAPMDWDTRFFGRLMGKVMLFETKGGQVGRRLLSALEQRCREIGYKHLMARMDGPLSREIWSFETCGYELMDIGTILVLHRAKEVIRLRSRAGDSHCLRMMEEKDLEFILSYVPSLFKLSYFYRDPFFPQTRGIAYTANG